MLFFFFFPSGDRGGKSVKKKRKTPKKTTNQISIPEAWDMGLSFIWVFKGNTWPL